MHPLAETSLRILEDVLMQLEAEAASETSPLDLHLLTMQIEACKFGIGLHHEYMVRNENYPV